MVVGCWRWGSGLSERRTQGGVEVGLRAVEAADGGGADAGLTGSSDSCGLLRPDAAGVVDDVTPAMELDGLRNGRMG
ncbi:hypothetical protein ACLOJK_027453 [Asimina triloba]